MNPNEPIIIQIPIRMHRMRGRVLVLAPDNPQQPVEDVYDRGALNLIATAFLWHQQLESGKYRTQRALAQAKGIHHSYVWKILKLVFLDPYIIRQLLNGRQPSGFSISEVFRHMPLRWEDQRRAFGFAPKAIIHSM